MVDEPVLDTNDQALVAHFLRGMTRFEKFVRAQGKTDLTERIEWAYSEALVKFVERQRQGGNECLTAQRHCTLNDGCTRSTLQKSSLKISGTTRGIWNKSKL